MHLMEDLTGSDKDTGASCLQACCDFLELNIPEHRMHRTCHLRVNAEACMFAPGFASCGVEHTIFLEHKELT